MQLLKGLVLAGLAMMTGCASLSESECLTADWHAIGYEDAAKGELSTRMGSHRQACAKHGVTPNLQQYRMGYDDGLNVFCTGSSGYNRGLNGHQYKGICPAHLEEDFLDGYVIGQEIYQAASEVDAIGSRQQSNYQEQQRIERQLEEHEAVLFDKSRSEAQRRETYKEISRLKEHQGRLRQEHDDLIRGMTDAEIRLRTLRSQYSHYR